MAKMQQTMHLAVFGATALTLIGLSAQAKATVFVVDDPKQRDLVNFTSDAPIELIQGQTHEIKGQITVDDSLDLGKKPLSAEFEVDLASIKTGIDLRDEHMRDNFLNTNQYPKAIFKVSTVTATPTVLKEGETVKAKAVGEFSLHGKTAKQEIPVDITFYKPCKGSGKFESCDLIQIKSTFPVAFKDYDIQRPQLIFQKLADTVLVTVSATAHHESSADSKKTTSTPQSNNASN